MNRRAAVRNTVSVSKPSTTWEALFTPPCPTCKGTDIEVVHTGANVMMNGKDFFNNICHGKNGMATKDPKSRSYRCRKCWTTWCDEGGMIVFDTKKRK